MLIYLYTSLPALIYIPSTSTKTSILTFFLTPAIYLPISLHFLFQFTFSLHNPPKHQAATSPHSSQAPGHLQESIVKVSQAWQGPLQRRAKAGQDVPSGRETLHRHPAASGPPARAITGVEGRRVTWRGGSPPPRPLSIRLLLCAGWVADVLLWFVLFVIV